ncbi:hypothetical protein [Actinokineospora globicatena]|uniref:hypothetical protein n=1 Tax=Actinokineospora globicatena TaxID=103729 RepID=UPI0020A2AE1F|nr:hypothetical protein [Actinokineospora globicatena]MCP2302829.1 hypothetical protein [Actinokineospora globicatena]GLW78788.1 hypothetical protein Aglo01_32700 [Actinokineospora globicatena]GLW84544.1 hypothetical protein Aglo02_21840 [Actinokineospora globicatena]
MSTSPGSDLTWRVETADEHAEVPAALPARLRDAVTAAPGLDCVGFFDQDDFVYGLNRLSGAGRWEALLRLGVHLAVAWRGLDRDLQPLRTGRLIRTVLDAEAGAVFCETVRPGRHVIGTVASATSAADRERADAALTTVVDHLRTADRLPTQNPGAFTDEGPEIPSTAERVLHTTGPSDLLAPLLPAIRLDGLHAIAYYTRGTQLATADCFDSPHLAQFHHLATPTDRRALYTTLGHDLAALATHLNQATAEALGGPLHRIVLDVQQGAIYYRRLPRQHYLVGLTLDQTQVRQADHQMHALAHHLSTTPA